jgi:hypothetical protein
MRWLVERNGTVWCGVVCAGVEERSEERTWNGRCVHPKTYVVPERIQAICARANPRAAAPLGIGSLVLWWPGNSNIALHLLEEPSYRAAPRDDFRVRVVQRVAACGQTVGREALHARAEGEEPDAARVGVVQREAGQDGVLAWLWGAGQRVVLGKSGRHDRIRHAAACDNGTLLH